MFEDGKLPSDDEIVIDPVVPASARHALARIGAAGQEKASNIRSRLIPYRQSPPQTPPPPKLVSGRHALAWGALALSFLVGALLAALAGSGGWVVILLIAAGATTVHSVMNVFATTRKSRAWAQEQWDMRYADAFYHRKYIVPRTDLDDEARPIWARAVAAANEIRESYVVKSHIVDSVQVAKALPQWLWEIADGLAALSQVRGLQREILRQDGSKAEQVTAKVSAQGREINAESRRLERRVRKLEETAGLMRDADAAKLPEMVVERLGGVDDLLGDLSARSAGIDALPDLDPTERLRLAAQVVIELANEAIRDLALPDLGEEEDSDANDDPGADDNA